MSEAAPSTSDMRTAPRLDTRRPRRLVRRETPQSTWDQDQWPRR